MISASLSLTTSTLMPCLPHVFVPWLLSLIISFSTSTFACAQLDWTLAVAVLVVLYFWFMLAGCGGGRVLGGPNLCA
jgi:hypothetical protein